MTARGSLLQAVSSITMNLTGDWVGLGVSAVGQLLVWEVKSETYILKQQVQNWLLLPLNTGVILLYKMYKNAGVTYW